MWGLKGLREWREGCSHSAPSTGGGACRQPVWPWHAHGCTRQGPQTWSPGGNNHQKNNHNYHNHLKTSKGIIIIIIIRSLPPHPGPEGTVQTPMACSGSFMHKEVPTWTTTGVYQEDSYLVDTIFLHSNWTLPSLLLFFGVVRLVQCC